jgi:thiamine kinase-like enzyme
MPDPNETSETDEASRVFSAIGLETVNGLWQGDERVDQLQITKTLITPPSFIAFLTVALTNGVSKRLIYKTPKRFKNEAGRKELIFYTELAGNLAEGRVPAFYGGSYNVAEDRYYLLLEDVSTRYRKLKWGIPPTLKQMEAIIAVLGELHATWWTHPSLTNQEPARAIAETVAVLTRSDYPRYQEFADILQDRLSKKRRCIYEMILRELPRVLEKRVTLGMLTVCHIDCHTGNFLIDESRDPHQVCILDWGSYEIGPAPIDLAFLLGAFHFRELRVEREEYLLGRYYESLIAGRVKDYTRERCWDDYRLGIAWNLVRLLGSRKHMEFVWPRLEALMGAFEDLKCGELLAP